MIIKVHVFNAVHTDTEQSYFKGAISEDQCWNGLANTDTENQDPHGMIVIRGPIWQTWCHRSLARDSIIVR